jgi:hypothetical protein
MIHVSNLQTPSERYILVFIILQEGATSMSESLQCVLDDHYLMSLTVLWAMNCYIPASYTADVEKDITSMDLIQSLSLVGH